MLYTDEFLETLRSDPLAGTLKICDLASASIKSNQNWTVGEYENLSEAFALLSEMADAGILPVDYSFPFISPLEILSEKCRAIKEVIDEIRDLSKSEADKTRLKRLSVRFKTSLGATFVYEFSQGDLVKMQALINSLRETISNTENLAPEHLRRLLNRLESLQSELHKKISDLDKFWGLIGDAGVVLGKLGHDAKPIVDRIREIADIVWQTQSRAEELPSGTALPQIAREKPVDPS